MRGREAKEKELETREEASKAIGGRTIYRQFPIFLVDKKMFFLLLLRNCVFFRSSNHKIIEFLI